jgi:hypothetical protein
MQAFSITAARQLNASIGRMNGPAFADRYYPRPLRSPRQVCNCIAYVRDNLRHDGAVRERLEPPWKVDPYASALSFRLGCGAVPWLGQPATTTAMSEQVVQLAGLSEQPQDSDTVCLAEANLATTERDDAQHPRHDSWPRSVGSHCLG